jgi:hypothetical protein
VAPDPVPRPDRHLRSARVHPVYPLPRAVGRLGRFFRGPRAMPVWDPWNLGFPCRRRLWQSGAGCRRSIDCPRRLLPCPGVEETLEHIERTSERNDPFNATGLSL